MRKSIIFLLAFVLITACNNNNKKNKQDEDKVRKEDRDKNNNDKDDRMEDKGEKNNNAYNWTVKEKSKFLADCKRESEEKAAGKKLDDFCSCMLTEVQKYYPTYSQMDEGSNEDNDKKILEKCVEYLGEEDEK